MRSVLGAHVEDLWGIALLTAAVLGAMAIYADALGPAGHGIRTDLGSLLGFGRFVLPPALTAAGILLFTGRSWRERSEHELARVGLGLALTLVGVGGLAELAGGSPALGATPSRLAGAGGWVGAAVGRPLEDAIGDWGTAVVLVAVLVVALVVFTGVSVREGARAVAVSSRTVARLFRSDRRQTESPEESNEETPTGREAGAATGTAETGARVVAEAAEQDVRGALGPAAFETEPAPTAAGTPGSVLGASPRTGEPDEREPVRALTSGGPAVAPVSAAPGARQLELDLGVPAGEWRLPPAKLLSRSRPQQLDRSEVVAAGTALVAALAVHGVDTRLVGYTVGPTVTRFELELGSGVKVARVTSLAKDIAYSMASPDVRILAPIPGRSAIGVEVPNRRRQLVTLGDVLSSEEARRARHPLEVALGRDVAGRPVMTNLADMPHILISGATGAGKSSCINSLVTSVLMRATPEEVRMILVDPKRVELGQYNGLPHLLTQVVVDPKKAANALAWAVAEMERRYDILAEAGMRDITGYNEAIGRGELGDGGALADAGSLADANADADADAGVLVDAGLDTDALAGGDSLTVADGDTGGHPPSATFEDGFASSVPGPVVWSGSAEEISTAEDASSGAAAPRVSMEPARRHRHLPYVLVVVDELNDLMMVAARDVEESVCRIAQMARAVGIHLVLATQRPSVDVITGLIKANIPSRLAFSVSSLADSRVILDQPGAERLIGKGDMLLLGASSSVPRRIQGPWVTQAEVRAVVAHWRRQRQPDYIEGVAASSEASLGGGKVIDDEDEELLAAAMELVVRSQLGSTSMLQRKLRVGFSRAGRLMDLLERRGIVGPSEGSKARAVLMTPEELEQTSRR
ncbi:MAG: DNA translocase FtsK [Acidimicrobiales bacterium]